MCSEPHPSSIHLASHKVKKRITHRTAAVKSGREGNYYAAFVYLSHGRGRRGRGRWQHHAGRVGAFIVVICTDICTQRLHRLFLLQAAVERMYVFPVSAFYSSWCRTTCSRAWGSGYFYPDLFSKVSSFFLRLHHIQGHGRGASYFVPRFIFRGFFFLLWTPDDYATLTFAFGCCPCEHTTVLYLFNLKENIG